MGLLQSSVWGHYDETSERPFFFFFSVKELATNWYLGVPVFQPLPYVLK